MNTTYYIEIPESLNVEMQDIMMDLEKDAFPGIGAVDEQTLVPLARYGKIVLCREQGDDRPIAVAELMRSYASADEAYIFGYYVRSDQQGKGIGKILLTELLEVIKKDGFKKVSLTVNTENLAAIKLYERFGFVIKETRKDEYGAGEDRYCMVLEF